MHVLITGCSTGIGRAAVEAFARAGHQVSATARNLAAIEDLRSGNVQVLRLDLTDRDSMPAAVEAARRWAPLDVLVNNAGYGQAGPLTELSQEEWLEQFQTNVFGLMELTRLVTNGPGGMIERRGGRIIMITSVVAHVATPFSGAYCATKFALRAISDTLRLELAPFGIRVVQVEPGPIRTRFADNSLARAAGLLSRRDTPYEFLRSAIEGRARRSQVGAAPASSVADAILRAAVARRPATRYPVTWQTRALKLVRSLFPERALDLILARVFGLPTKPRP